MIPISGMFPEEIAQALSLKPMQASQLFRWIHQKQVFDLDEMSNLPKVVRQELRKKILSPQLVMDDYQESSRAEGTCKALYRLHDGEQVESVYIPTRKRITICVSSQGRISKNSF